MKDAAMPAALHAPEVAVHVGRLPARVVHGLPDVVPVRVVRTHDNHGVVGSAATEGAAAGVEHALLCRDYLKGRDWYDFVWYSARQVPVNHELLSASLDQQGPWMGQAPRTDDTWCVERLRARITKLDWRQARRDMQRFVKPHELPSLELWTREFFLQQCDKLGQSGSPR